MFGGLFEVLLLAGLLLLIIAVAAAAVLISRRPRAVSEQILPAGQDPEPYDDLREDSAAALAAEARADTDAYRAKVEAQADDYRAETHAKADAYGVAVHAKAEELLNAARTARTEAEEEVRARRSEMREQRSDLERREQRLADREERLDAEARALEERARQLDELKSDLKVQRRALAGQEAEHQQALERVAGLTAEQAKADLVAAVEHDAKRQAVLVARDIERQALREAEVRAQSIVVSAIQRVASEQTSESVVSAVHLPGDDMKGRIIGREGRNIRAFEQVTGVNVMIDDTPESVLLSCFDPVRRETARMTLTELVRDGRIHPARIEEVHERSVPRIGIRAG